MTSDDEKNRGRLVDRLQNAMYVRGSARARLSEAQSALQLAEEIVAAAEERLAEFDRQHST